MRSLLVNIWYNMRWKEGTMNKVIAVFIIGICSGIITFIFGSGLNLIINMSTKMSMYNVLLLPFVGLLTIYLRNRYKDEVDGSMGKIFKSTKEEERLSLLIIPFQMITTWLAHFTGASVGREGVAVQLGATFSNYISHLMPDVNRQNLTRIGMAAGFAGLFGTPLAATIFCYEVTRKHSYNLALIIYTLIATYIASMTSSLLGLSHFHFKIQFVQLSIIQIILLIICIFAFGIIGQFFALTLRLLKIKFASFQISQSVLIVGFSIIGGILLIAINDGRYMSLGTNIINDAFYSPENIKILDFMFKLLFTTFFVAVGFQGGEVTPLFAIGASLGVTLAIIFNLPVAIVAAIGYGFVFASATGAKYAGSILVLEVFGIALLPYVIIACVVYKYVIKLNESIYPVLPIT